MRRTGVGLLLLTPVALVFGCGRNSGPEAGAEAVRVTRYNCNIAESRDVIDVYAEVLNGGSGRTGPLDLVARVIRPDEEVVEGRVSMGRLGAHEERHVSLRLTCKGSVALRHMSLAVEPTPAPQEPEDSPTEGR
ncbi:MAG: hypothetical protein PVH68_16390 [Armatimonadota bacterium]